ncbi:MAG: glutamine synthetase III [Clostridia bacterium]
MLTLQETMPYGNFGADVFSDEVMRQRLNAETYAALRNIIDEAGTLTFDLAGVVAKAMMEWALEKGATHYTHWFQPMTGATAEKRDTFLEHSALDKTPILSFSAKALIKGEADGSSFPTGGLRLTFEARGYTTWDCTSPAFIKRDANGSCCLCIPTAFCSFSGEALDEKTPLLRSMDAINKQAVRVLRLLGEDVKRVKPTVGAEQEYFLVEKGSFRKRKDLAYTGRTLFGTIPAKGQELSDQYYAATPERVIAFMKDLNEALWRMGVPCKTEHNEAAPSQYELAPVFESANVAVDHNQLVMEMMRRLAERHGMTCLLHEKPFENVNGSGKHNNWSLVTDDGRNLFKPGKDESSNRIFFTFLLATIAAVDEYAGMLRLSCASIGNENRLGGHEAPTPIISIFTGELLQKELGQLAEGSGMVPHKKEMMNIGVSTMATLLKDDTDRNRTSPFAFTGNKFEFRMVGSSQSLGMPNTVLNTIVAESLMRIADQLEKTADVDKAWPKLMSELYREHGHIIFNGNNYDPAWAVEAKRRGLQNIDNTVDAILISREKTVRSVFSRHGVMTEGELAARTEIALKNYATSARIEATTMLKMVRQSIMPAIMGYAEELVDTVYKASQCLVAVPAQTAMLNDVNKKLNECRIASDMLDAALSKMPGSDCALEAATAFRDSVKPRMVKLRNIVDKLECIVGKRFWPLPSYGEMLFKIES